MRVKGALLLLFFNTMVLMAQKNVTVYFGFDKATLHEASIETLEKGLVDGKQDHTKTIEVLKIYGFADAVGTQAYNEMLSLKRAHAVLAFCKEHRVPISKDLEVKGFGSHFEQAAQVWENRKVVLYYTEYPVQKIEDVVVHREEQGQTKKKIPQEIIDLFQDSISELKEPMPPKKQEIPHDAPLEMKVNHAKVGDKLKLQDVNFYENTYGIVKESGPRMEELLAVMRKNPTLKIEIQGHICCNANAKEKLSTERAKAVYMYLIANGIDKKRLSYKGFGSTEPKYPLPEQNEEQRAANRRVEILIIEKD